VGVHYPTDVLGGAIVGVLCAVIIIEIEKWIAKLWKKRIEKRQTGEEDAQEGESY
jgi:membrane-associated phospholipid phosphatase